jgi:uncharacterized membrane protein YqhA
MEHLKKVSFVNNLQEHNVTYSNINIVIIGLFGLVLWAAPLICYSIALSRSSGIAQSVWITDIVLHVITGILVDIDAVFFAGTFWPLQTLIIGFATFITFTLPGFFGYYMSIHDETGVLLSLLALGLACISNAVLVSILFEYFHKFINKLQNDIPKNTKQIKISVQELEERKKSSR